MPFIAYADFFMRMSVRISRAQELAADAVSARVGGASAAACALRKVDILSVAWDTYFRTEVLPLLANRRIPDILAGFEMYWQTAQTPGTPAFESLVVAVADGARARDDDTHPTLAARLAALGIRRRWSRHRRRRLR